MALSGTVSSFLFLALQLTPCVSVRKSFQSDDLTTNHSNPCANHDVDVFAEDPTGEWCYIRMYKCQDVQELWRQQAKAKGVTVWQAIEYYGLKNANTGDVVWGGGGKKLGDMVCTHYGHYLEVWRVAVKKELINKKPHYSQCNDGVCGCGMKGNCHGKGPDTNFGWRYKGEHNKAEKDSKRQFSLPDGSRGTQWKDLCLELVVTSECVKKTTYDSGSGDELARKFAQDVLENPVPGCEAEHHHVCMPDTNHNNPTPVNPTPVNPTPVNPTPDKPTRGSYEKYSKTNCYTGHGAASGDNDSEAREGLSVDECQQRCDADSNCNCIVVSGHGKCFKRKDCQPKKCKHANWADVYVKA